jgi:hypothetical protein
VGHHPPAQAAGEQGPAGGVLGGQGFVQKQDGGTPEEGAGEAQPVQFAPRQPGGGTVKQGREAQFRRQGVQGSAAPGGQAQLEAHRQVGQPGRPLGGHGDRPLPCGQVPQGVIRQVDPLAGPDRALKAGNEPEQAGLARSGRAHQGQHLPRRRLHLQVQVQAPSAVLTADAQHADPPP